MEHRYTEDWDDFIEHVERLRDHMANVVGVPTCKVELLNWDGKPDTLAYTSFSFEVLINSLMCTAFNDKFGDVPVAILNMLTRTLDDLGTLSAEYAIENRDKLSVNDDIPIVFKQAFEENDNE